MKFPALLALAFPLLQFPAAARTFTGDGADANWSTAANWNPAAAPAPADSLVFVLSAISSNNNLSAATFHDLDFNARHTLSGNPFTLTSGITASAGNTRSVAISQNITLGADQAFNVATGSLVCDGGVLLNGHQLSVNGAGTLQLNSVVTGTGAASRIVKSGAGTLRIGPSAIVNNAGGISVSSGDLAVLGFVIGGPVSMTGGKLTGDGQLSALSATGGEIAPAGGDLSVSSGLTLGPNAKVTVILTGPGQAHSISVTGGAVDLGDDPDLGGAELVVDASAYSPVWDEDFTILSKGDAGPIAGKFKNLPEGADILINATTTGRIHYNGGNGNDVVIDIVSTTRTWDGDTVANDNWTEAGNWSQNTRPNFGDVLVFPAGIQATDRGVDNDFANDTTFRQLVFNGTDFTVRGSRFRLSHGINLGAGVTANLDTTAVLALDQTFNLGSGSTLHLDLLDEIDTSGHTLSVAGGESVSGTIDGTISGSGGLTVASGGLVLTANCTYSGLTVIEPGSTLRLTNSAAGVQSRPGNTSGGTRIAGKLALENNSVNLAFKIEDQLTLLPGGEMFASGIGGDQGAKTEILGNTTLEGFSAGSLPAVIGSVHGRMDISGIIQGHGDLVNNGGLVRLNGSGSNSFTGSLKVKAGTLELEKSALGTIAVSCERLEATGAAFAGVVETHEDEQIIDTCDVAVNQSGKLRIGGILSYQETIRSLTFSESALVEGGVNSLLKVRGNITAASGTPAIQLPVQIQGTPCDLTVQGGARMIMNSEGSLTRSGSASIRRLGAGKAALFGPVVAPFELKAGETLFHGNAAASPITLNGGTAGGGGTVGAITSQTDGGAIAPGEDGTGILTSGSLTLNAATSLKIEVVNATAGSGNDRLVALGTVNLGAGAPNLGGAVLNLVEQPGFNVAFGAQVFPLLNDGTDAIVGTFAGLPEGAFIPASTGGWIIGYKGGDGNDVVLTRVSAAPAAPKLNTVTISKGTGAGGQDQVTLSGTAAASAVFNVEASTNLATWTTVRSVTATAAGVVNATFTQTPGIPVRFFRLKP